MRSAAPPLRRSAALVLLVATACDSGGPTGPDGPGDGVELVQVASGLTFPVLVTAPLHDQTRLFVVEKGGLIKIIKNGQVLATPFLDIRSKVSRGGEQGLLGLAFHPDYATNHLFVIDYTDTNGDTRVSVIKVSANPDVADPSQRGGVPVRGPALRQSQRRPCHLRAVRIPLHRHGRRRIRRRSRRPRPGPRHAVRQAAALPDGRSGPRHAFPMATRSSGIRASSGGSGAPAFAIPGASASTARPAPSTSATWDRTRPKKSTSSPAPTVTAAGANFGWRIMEGSQCYNPPTNCDRRTLVLPLVEYDHGEGCSVTGGHVYRGNDLPDTARALLLRGLLRRVGPELPVRQRRGGGPARMARSLAPARTSPASAKTPRVSCTS